MNKHTKLWILTFDSKEAAVNLYGILLAFQQSQGGGLLNKEAVRCVARWLEAISRQVPDVGDLSNDSRGPFRLRDLSPIAASLELDSKERSLMLYICKIISEELATPQGRRDWIKNQGQADYDLAVKHYTMWLAVLEDEKASLGRLS
jgi:hypothetical protein